MIIFIEYYNHLSILIQKKQENKKKVYPPGEKTKKDAILPLAKIFF